MHSDPHPIELARRIETLERQNRRMKRIAMLGVPLGLLLFVGWAPIDQEPSGSDPSVELIDDSEAAIQPAPPVHREAEGADRLVIGKDGGFSVVLEGGPDAARILMLDREKRIRSQWELTDSGIISRMLDKNGQGRFDLLITDRQVGSLGNNEARLKISDVRGNDAVLLVSTNGSQGAVIINPDGHNIALLANSAKEKAEAQPE